MIDRRTLTKNELLSSGYKSIQELQVGDKIYGYAFKHGITSPSETEGDYKIHFTSNIQSLELQFERWTPFEYNNRTSIVRGIVLTFKSNFSGYYGNAYWTHKLYLETTTGTKYNVHVAKGTINRVFHNHINPSLVDQMNCGRETEGKQPLETYTTSDHVSLSEFYVPVYFGNMVLKEDYRSNGSASINNEIINNDVQIYYDGTLNTFPIDDDSIYFLTEDPDQQ